MGPLLFYIFINDIFLFNSDINIYNYADDNCISFEGRSIDIITDTLHKEGVSLMDWFKKNSLAANPAIFQTVLLKSNSVKDIQLNVTVENIPLPSSDTMKALGIDIENSLTFDGHISNMCIKALRFVLDDYQSGYTDLLQNANVPGIKIMLLRYNVIEVFKCIYEINPVHT